MNALFVTLLVSFTLVALGVVLFIYSVKQRDHEHGPRLSLLPLEDDVAPVAPMRDADRNHDEKEGSQRDDGSHDNVR